MWSAALTAGISDRLFWTLAPPEIYAVLEAYAEKQRREDLRAGLIAATLVNVNRSSTSTAMARPEDFFPQRDREEDYMSEEEAKIALTAWAASQNAARQEDLEAVVEEYR